MMFRSQLFSSRYSFWITGVPIQCSINLPMFVSGSRFIQCSTSSLMFVTDASICNTSFFKFVTSGSRLPVHFNDISTSHSIFNFRHRTFITTSWTPIIVRQCLSPNITTCSTYNIIFGLSSRARYYKISISSLQLLLDISFIVTVSL